MIHISHIFGHPGRHFLQVDTFTLAGFSPGLSLYVYDKEVVEVTESVVLETKTQRDSARLSAEHGRTTASDESAATPRFFAFYNTANMLGGHRSQADFH